MTDYDKALEKSFLDYAELSIEESGVFPLPCAYLTSDGKPVMAALAVANKEIPKTIQHILFESPPELYFAIDRFTKPGQGTEFDSALTICHWKNGKWVRFGVIEYQSSPKMIKPVVWDNKYWIKIMERESEFYDPFSNITVKRPVETQ